MTHQQRIANLHRRWLAAKADEHPEGVELANPFGENAKEDSDYSLWAMSIQADETEFFEEAKRIRGERVAKHKTGHDEKSHGRRLGTGDTHDDYFKGFVASIGTKLYHASNPSSRDVILREGLDPSVDLAPTARDPAVYLSPLMPQVVDQDVYEVDVGGLRVYADSPEQMAEFQAEGGSYAVLVRVPPERLRLVVRKHLRGQHDQLTHGRRGSYGGGLFSASMIPDGGFTIRPLEGVAQPVTGYALSINPERGRKFSNGRGYTRSALRRYIRRNLAFLKADRRLHVGAWRDPQTGDVWLDVSVVVPSLEQARSLAQEHGELALYGFAERRSIRV